MLWIVGYLLIGVLTAVWFRHAVNAAALASELRRDVVTLFIILLWPAALARTAQHVVRMMCR